MGPLGVPELLIILVLVLIVFGAGRLPDVMGSLGKGVSAFRKASTDDDLEADANATGVTKAEPKPEQKPEPQPEPQRQPEPQPVGDAEVRAGPGL